MYIQNLNFRLQNGPIQKKKYNWSILKSGCTSGHVNNLPRISYVSKWHLKNYNVFRIVKMKFVDRVKVFYLYNLRFLRNRQFIRAVKTATGMGILTGTSYWYYTQLNAAIDEKKQRRTGRDSLIAAGVLSQVSGYGENKLAPGKSLQGYISIIPFKYIRDMPQNDPKLL